MINDLNKLPSYDTLILRLYAEDVPDVLLLHEIPQYLHGRGKYCPEEFKNKFSVYGHLKNLKIKITSNYIEIDGSISKWYLGNNIQHLSLSDMKKCVEKLSSELHLPIEKAHVKRFDLSSCLVMKHEADLYLTLLGRHGRVFPRHEPDGIYYDLSENDQLLFYDKTVESKGMVPEEYEGYNLLRYEKRFYNTGIRLENLYDMNYYICFVKDWIEKYNDIVKINNITLDCDLIKGTESLKATGVLTLVALMGGLLKIEQQINDNKKMRKLTSKQAHDILNYLESLNNAKSGIVTINPLISELNETIESISSILSSNFY